MKRRHKDIGPLIDRQRCSCCGNKGTLKIIINNNNKQIIKRFLSNVMYFFEVDNEVECFCSYCCDERKYKLASSLFQDGVVKEL